MAERDQNDSGTGRMANSPLSRRVFLRLLAMAGLAVPVISMAGCDKNQSASRNDGKVDAFKLSSRGRNACNACRNHARYKIFSSAKAADTHRAHAGCKCAIKLVRIPKVEAGQYFAEFPYHDRRVGNA